MKTYRSNSGFSLIELVAIRPVMWMARTALRPRSMSPAPSLGTRRRSNTRARSNCELSATELATDAPTSSTSWLWIAWATSRPPAAWSWFRTTGAAAAPISLGLVELYRLGCCAIGRCGGRCTRARKARRWSRAKVKWEMSPNK